MSRSSTSDLGRPHQAAGLHRRHHARHRGAGGHHRQPLLRGHPRVQGRVRRRHRRRQGRRHPGRRRQGRHGQGHRDRRPHPRPGDLHRRRGHRGHRRHQRRHPLPQPRRPALHLAHPGDRRHRRGWPSGATIPVDRDLAGARPHRALQRLQAAVPGAVAHRHQPALLRDRPGLPGRGRHARGAARAHRLGDLDPRRPRPGDRRAHRQPQRGARPRRRPRRAARRG